SAINAGTNTDIINISLGLCLHTHAILPRRLSFKMGKYKTAPKWNPLVQNRAALCRSRRVLIVGEYNITRLILYINTYALRIAGKATKRVIRTIGYRKINIRRSDLLPRGEAQYLLSYKHLGPRIHQGRTRCLRHIPSGETVFKRKVRNLLIGRIGVGDLVTVQIKRNVVSQENRRALA